MNRLEWFARWIAILCGVTAAAVTWTAAAVGTVIYGTTTGGWSWLVVAVMELLLLALVAIAVSGLCAARREDRELAAAKAKLAAVEVEASLRLVEHDLEETKRSLRGIR